MNTNEQVKVRDLETGQAETIEIYFKKRQLIETAFINCKSIHPCGRKPVKQIVSADGKTRYVPRT